MSDTVDHLISMDFFAVPMATFQVLFGLVVLAHRRRSVVHLNVTEHPTAASAATIRGTVSGRGDEFPSSTCPRVIEAGETALGSKPFRRRTNHHKRVTRKHTNRARLLPFSGRSSSFLTPTGHNEREASQLTLMGHNLAASARELRGKADHRQPAKALETHPSISAHSAPGQ